MLNLLTGMRDSSRVYPLRRLELPRATVKMKNKKKPKPTTMRMMKRRTPMLCLIVMNQLMRKSKFLREILLNLIDFIL